MTSPSRSKRDFMSLTVAGLGGLLVGPMQEEEPHAADPENGKDIQPLRLALLL